MIQEVNYGTLNFIKPKKSHYYLGNGKFKRVQSTYNFLRIKRKIRQRIKSNVKK